MHLRILKSMVLFSIMLILFATTVQANEAVITIPYDNTQIRNGPSTDDKIIHFADKGSKFDVLSETAEWCKISNNHVKGYVFKRLVDKQTARAGDGIKNKTIVIDAGHGGNDVGAIGATGSFEKDITYKTALALQRELTTLGATAILTRKQDDYISLAARTSLTNITDTDAFISIHYNSVPAIPDVTGIGTYYYDDQNKKLADYVQIETTKGTEAKDRGTAFGDFQVLRQNFKPAILVELGFISNPKREQLLLTDSYQTQLVHGIIAGLSRYFR